MNPTTLETVTLCVIILALLPKCSDTIGNIINRIYRRITKYKRMYKYTCEDVERLIHENRELQQKLKTKKRRR